MAITSTILGSIGAAVASAASATTAAAASAGSALAGLLSTAAAGTATGAATGTAATVGTTAATSAAATGATAATATGTSAGTAASTAVAGGMAGVAKSAATGAMMGGALDAGNTALQGGSLSDVARAGAKGAALGAATGVVGAGAGNLLKGIGSKITGAFGKTAGASTEAVNTAANATESITNTTVTNTAAASTEVAKQGASATNKITGNVVDKAGNITGQIQANLPKGFDPKVGTAKKIAPAGYKQLGTQGVSPQLGNAASTTNPTFTRSATGKIVDVAKGAGSKVVAQGALSLLSAGMASKSALESNAIQRQSLLFQQQSYNDAQAEKDRVKAQLKEDAWNSYNSAQSFGSTLYNSDSNNTLLTNYESGNTGIYSILSTGVSTRKSDLT